MEAHAERLSVQNLRLRDTAAERHEEERERAQRDAVTLVELLAGGVTIGAPVEADSSGCGSCVWHAENVTEDRSDGGVIGAIRYWIDEGYLGEPANIVLHPVITKA